MKAKNKYEVFIWLGMGLLIGLVSYSTYLDFQQRLTDYPSKTGSIKTIGLCEHETTALVRGVPNKLKSKVFCMDIGASKNFQIFKTNRNYKALLNQLQVGDQVKVFYSDEYNDKGFTVIQLQKNNHVVYSFKQRKKQEQRELIALIGSSLLFICLGVIRHIRYLKG